MPVGYNWVGRTGSLRVGSLIEKETQKQAENKLQMSVISR